MKTGLVFWFSLLAGAATAGSCWFWLEVKAYRALQNRMQEPRRKSWSFNLRRGASKWQCFSQFPDFLELLSMGLSAGLNLQEAWAMAIRHMPSGVLQKELLHTSEGMTWGRPREELLNELRKKLADDRLDMIFSLIIQSMKRGSELESTLLDQAASLRAMRLSLIEKKAQTASLRMLFPILLFIFPTIFLILFAPLFIRLSQGLSIF